MSTEQFYRFLYLIVWHFFNLVLPVRTVGREHIPEGAAVSCPNHTALSDPFFVAFAFQKKNPLRVMAKIQLMRVPVIGWLLGKAGIFGVARGHADMHAAKTARRGLKEGHKLLIFPEGTRTKTGMLGVIKSGAFVIAAAAGADMLPVRIIYGTKDGRLHLFCKLRIVFGEPIPAADLQIRDQSHKMAELRRMKNRLRDELEQLLADNAFAVRLAETAAEEPAAPDDKPQLPE